MKIAFLQPIIPHYRQVFFEGLKKKISYDLFSFGENFSHRDSLVESSNNYKIVSLFKFFKFKWYNPIFFLRNYDIIIIPGEISYLSNWFLLLFSYAYKKKVIIFGHGVNYSREKPVSTFLYLMYYLSSSAIFYTEKEMRFWRRVFRKKQFSFVQNTIYKDTIKINSFYNSNSIKKIKEKYNISHKKIFISCYRFTNSFRKDKELHRLISNINNSQNDVGFIIIGSGKLKPDFSQLNNVYDFGELYDEKIKMELFYISDFYLQLGWTGLSIVEAFSYKKPVVTLRRSSSVKQSVEYYYLRNQINSIILNSINNFNSILSISNNDILKLSQNAQKSFDKLKITSMISKCAQHLNKVTNV